MTTDNSIMSWSGLKSLERVKIDWVITGDGIEGEARAGIYRESGDSWRGAGFY
jgi:hypothetical protein